MSDHRPPVQPRKKFILNDYRQPLPVSDAPVAGGKYPAQLMFEQMNNGKIVLKVQDGVYTPGANKNTHKEVEMDWGDRNFFFESMLEAATDANFGMRKVTPRRRQYVHAPGGGKMSENPVVQVNLVITRDEAGVITLGWSKGDYKVTFTFKGPRDMLVMMKGTDGVAKEDHGFSSRMNVRAWVKFHRPILDQMEQNVWEPPKPKGDAAAPRASNPANSFDSEDNGFDDNF